jgi:hypothetical protein
VCGGLIYATVLRLRVCEAVLFICVVWCVTLVGKLRHLSFYVDTTYCYTANRPQTRVIYLDVSKYFHVQVLDFF